MALKRVNLNLEEGLLGQLDDYAASMHVNRSAALAVALSQYFSEKRALTTLETITNLIKNEQLKLGGAEE